MEQYSSLGVQTYVAEGELHRATVITHNLLALRSFGVTKRVNITLTT